MRGHIYDPIEEEFEFNDHVTAGHGQNILRPNDLLQCYQQPSFIR